MRVIAPRRASTIDRIAKALEEGQEKDAAGNTLRLEAEGMPVEIGPGMGFFIGLDRELAGARAENGCIHPDAIEAALDRRGIYIPENRDVTRRMLDALAAGRAEASGEKIEPERNPKPKHK